MQRSAKSPARIACVAKDGEHYLVASVDDIDPARAQAAMVTGATQEAIRHTINGPLLGGVPVAFELGTKHAPHPAPTNIQKVCVMAQWESPYGRSATRWRTGLKAAWPVEDLRAEKYGRDSALSAISGAGLVVYFGHASHTGFSGYHGIALEHVRALSSMGIFWSWSCNTIFGRGAFAIRLVQLGVTGAFVGTTDDAARTRDNADLSQLAARVLVDQNPARLVDWIRGIDDRLASGSVTRLQQAWQHFRIVGDILQPLPPTAATAR